MWCDNFDADLLKVVPGAAEALSDAGSLRLTTYSRTTGGKINHPSCWNMSVGTCAWFWTREDGKPDPAYWTDAPEAGCTLLEAVRDEWVHGCTVVVDHVIAWRPPRTLMTMLMYDLRGWTPVKDEIRERCRENVRESLRAASATLGLARAREKRLRHPKVTEALRFNRCVLDGGQPTG